MPKRQAAPASTFELAASPPIGECLDEFLDNYRYSGSPKTLAYYLDNVDRAFRLFLEERRVRFPGEITPALLREYLMRESTHLAPSTLGHRFRTAHTFLNFCVQQEWVERCPFERVKRPKPPELVREGYTREEVSLLLKAAGTSFGIMALRNRAIVLCLLGMGLRADELLGMTWDGVDLSNRLVRVMGKGRKERKLRMGTRVHGALKSWRRVCPALPGQPVWVTQRRTPMNYSTLNAMLKALGKRTDIEDVIPHRFRHTAAAEHYLAHHDLIATKNFLRHSQVTTTMRYLRSLSINYEGDDRMALPDEWLG